MTTHRSPESILIMRGDDTSFAGKCILISRDRASSDPTSTTDRTLGGTGAVMSVDAGGTLRRENDVEVIGTLNMSSRRVTSCRHSCDMNSWCACVNRDYNEIKPRLNRDFVTVFWIASRPN